MSTYKHNKTKHPVNLLRKWAINYITNNGVTSSGSNSNKELSQKVALIKNTTVPATKVGMHELFASLQTSPMRLMSKETSKKRKITHFINKEKVAQLKTNKIFYDSDAWKALRYKALSHNGAACQCCGRTYKEHKVVIHVDHIKPRSKFPELELELSNLQILCADCNIGKSNRDTIDWREQPITETIKRTIILRRRSKL